jgi:hypothetical protein
MSIIEFTHYDRHSMVSESSEVHENDNNEENLFVISTCDTIPKQDSLFYNIKTHHQITHKVVPFKSLCEVFKVDYLSDVLTSLFSRYTHENGKKNDVYLKNTFREIKQLLENRKNVSYDIKHFNEQDIHSIGNKIASDSGFKYYSEEIEVGCREMYSIGNKEVEQLGILLLLILKKHITDKNKKTTKVILLDAFGYLKSKSTFYSILPIIRILNAFEIDIEIHNCQYEESTPFISEALKELNNPNTKKNLYNRVLVK